MTILRHVAIALVLALSSQAADLALSQDGQVRCIIVTAPDAMSWEGDDAPIDRWGRMAGKNMLEAQAEQERRLARDSIRDLQLYLSRMIGAEVAIATEHAATDTRVPIYVGAPAQAVFGPVGASLAGTFGFRVVAGANGIGLYGESGFGTSYAIYELLHRLGCRWYMPSAMGEVIPTTPTLTVAPMDESLAPATEVRRMEGRVADADFRRRNRLNGTTINAQHTLEGYITAEQRAAHPEWCLHVDGKPHPRYLRWTRQDVADAIADAIIAKLDASYTPTISLSPGDYVVPTEDPEERKFDPEPRVWEPAAKQWSVTDRLVLLANRVAERVGQKYPDVLFGLLVYVNYSMPPAKYQVHPNVIPMIAPIDFNRQHPMTWKNHPNETWLLDMVQGWGKAAPRLAYYAYGMNLAELSAPNPFITKWGTNIPIVLANNVAFWTPETMGGWASMMPGYYLSIRMTFYPDEKPEAIIDELMTRFYGAAAEPMKNYWLHIDRCWIETAEYAGCAFGYLRMFTPERMATARAHIDEALASCRTIEEYQRVELINRSFTLFELFMQMREDWAAGRVAKLDKSLEDWSASVRHLRRQYAEQYSFGGLTLSYVEWFFKRSYDGGAELMRTHRPLGKPLTEWKYQWDEDATAEANGWTAPDFDDAEWPSTHVIRETWSTIGHHNSMGHMAYRSTARVNAVPDGKKATLWIGATDGRAKVFVNGKHIPFVVPTKTRHHEAGDVVDQFDGFGTPAAFDVTEALQPGENQITILCERYWLNELGTGGLMGPVLIVTEK